jgi:hypothetical protein
MAFALRERVTLHPIVRSFRSDLSDTESVDVKTGWGGSSNLTRPVLFDFSAILLSKPNRKSP